MSIKRQILESLDEYGPTNVADLFARLDTGQTKAQFSSYLGVLQCDNRVVAYDRENQHWSLTETGEKWLAIPPAQSKKKSATPPGEDHQAPIDDEPESDQSTTRAWQPKAAEEMLERFNESNAIRENVDAVVEDALRAQAKARAKALRQPGPDEPELPVNNIGSSHNAEEIIDKTGNEFGEPGTNLAAVPTESPIDHPPHYNDHPSGVECIQITEHMNFNLGNAIKYIWRAGLKGRQQQDLEKARWYIEREIQRLEAAQ